MGRKKKYENALIVKDILARECHAMGDVQGGIMFRFLDLKKKDDREFLKREIKGVAKIFNDAIKELEDGKNESNDKHADESVETNQKLKKKKEE